MVLLSRTLPIFLVLFNVLLLLSTICGAMEASSQPPRNFYLSQLGAQISNLEKELGDISSEQAQLNEEKSNKTKEKDQLNKQIDLKKQGKESNKSEPGRFKKISPDRKLEIVQNEMDRLEIKIQLLDEKYRQKGQELKIKREEYEKEVLRLQRPFAAAGRMQDVVIGEGEAEIKSILRRMKYPPSKLILYDYNLESSYATNEFVGFEDNYYSLYYGDNKFFKYSYLDYMMRTPISAEGAACKNITPLDSLFSLCLSPTQTNYADFLHFFKHPDVSPTIIMEKIGWGNNFINTFQRELNNARIFLDKKEIRKIILDGLKIIHNGYNSILGEPLKYDVPQEVDKEEQIQNAIRYLKENRLNVAELPEDSSNLNEMQENYTAENTKLKTDSEKYLNQKDEIRKNCGRENFLAKVCERSREKLKEIVDHLYENKNNLESIIEQRLPNPPTLHLKSIIFENTTVWGSANLTPTALTNNAELIMFDNRPALKCATLTFLKQFGLKEGGCESVSLLKGFEDFKKALEGLRIDTKAESAFYQLMSGGIEKKLISFPDDKTMVIFNNNHDYGKLIAKFTADLIKTADKQVVLSSMNYNLPKEIKEALVETSKRNDDLSVTLFVDNDWYERFKPSNRHYFFSNNLRRFSGKIIPISMKKSPHEFASYHAKMIIIDNKIAIFTTANISDGYSRNINQFYITTNPRLIRQALRWLNLYYHYAHIQNSSSGNGEKTSVASYQMVEGVSTGSTRQTVSQREQKRRRGFHTAYQPERQSVGSKRKREEEGKEEKQAEKTIEPKSKRPKDMESPKTTTSSFEKEGYASGSKEEARYQNERFSQGKIGSGEQERRSTKRKEYDSKDDPTKARQEPRAKRSKEGESDRPISTTRRPDEGGAYLKNRYGRPRDTSRTSNRRPMHAHQPLPRNEPAGDQDAMEWQGSGGKKQEIRHGKMKIDH